MIVLHLKTKHDSNGNPRRLYLPLVDNDWLGLRQVVIDEGYAGTSVIREMYPDEELNIFVINVTITEYNEWIKEAKQYKTFYQ